MWQRSELPNWEPRSSLSKKIKLEGPALIADAFPPSRFSQILNSFVLLEVPQSFDPLSKKDSILSNR